MARVCVFVSGACVHLVSTTMPSALSIFVFFACIFAAIAVQERSIFVDQHYDGAMNDYDTEVIDFVAELNPLVDYRGPVDENRVRMILIAADRYQQLAKSLESERYTQMFPLFQDGIDEMITKAAAHFVNEQVPQNLHDDLQAHARSAAARAISARIIE